MSSNSVSLFLIRPWTADNTMESPRKFNDCYFYYYSTCIKGDNCVFRHEPTALGCETMCTAWQQGKCLDKRCKLRHMELRKNRKQIPCYWENQPGGCRKKHCPFMHKNPDARTDGIAPSQPAPLVVATPAVAENSIEQPTLNSGVAPPVAAPAPVPLLWQQQRQVVLDSAILGVLPASSDLLGARRVLPPHAHAHAHPHPHEAPNPYAPLPVDPLVVNFEEESDSESAPSSTPTKTVSSDDAQKIARTKSQELLLLERIQAEAAAFYSYEAPAPEQPSERKIVRTNLATKYDRLSLDEIAGKKQTTEARSLDFKVLSLDEIRAKKNLSEANAHAPPITLNLSRKRKLSTQEINTTTGKKIIKVVRSNSIVYKKLEKGAPAQTGQARREKRSESVSRKRTLSELSDICDVQEDELVDNCHEFKRIKIGEQTSKPILIRNRHTSTCTTTSETNDEQNDCGSRAENDQDSDVEVQFVSIHISEGAGVDEPTGGEVIDLDSAKMGEPIDIVDLCEDAEGSDDIAVTDLVKNVPDVVASCQMNIGNDCGEKDILNDIDALLDDDL
ncbi:unnamed protein product, partial [Iphiclides podalirius]